MAGSMNMNAQVRRARNEDASQIASLFLTAGRGQASKGFYDSLHPGDECSVKRTLAEIITSSVQSYCHLNHIILGEVKGEVVCVVSSFGHDLATRSGLIKALKLLAWTDQFSIPAVRCKQNSSSSKQDYKNLY